jgi:hypothetical protein
MRHPRRKQLRSWLIAFFATLVGLSVAVVVMRPEEGPVASSLYDGPISPGTVARIRIDVRPVGGADFPEELQATAELVSIDLILVGVVVSITQVETLGDSLQVAIAVSVLLWTSREALVPGAPKLFLAVDAIFLGLALLVLGNVLILGWRHGAKRADPREGQDAAHPAGEALHSQKPAGRAGADNNRLILLGLAALVVIVAGGRELPLGARHRPGRRALASPPAGRGKKPARTPALPGTRPRRFEVGDLPSTDSRRSSRRSKSRRR